jgi:hypothetical protein
VVPLLLLSGIFLPLTLGPGWLQGIARLARSATSSTPCARPISATTSTRS